MALFLAVGMAGIVHGQSPAQLDELIRLRNLLETTRTTTREMSEEKRKQVERRQQEIAALENEIRSLQQKRSELGKAAPAPAPATPVAAEPSTTKLFDTVVLKSGRSVKCRVAGYENQRFILEDRDGNRIPVSDSAMTSVRFRNQTDADVFPRHVVNQTSRKSANPRIPATPTPESAFDVKEYMVNMKMIRRRSTDSADIREGFVDEYVEFVQYTCHIESRALPAEAKDLRVRIWVFAEDVTMDKAPLKLILLEDKRFDLPRLGEIEVDTREAKLEYDEVGAKYGHKFYGYVALLEDSKGNQVVVKRNRKALEDHLDHIKTLSLHGELAL